jgi:hypothetical protein
MNGEKRMQMNNDQPKYSRLAFLISLLTPLILLGLLAFGAILGITKLIKMIWDLF